MQSHDAFTRCGPRPRPRTRTRRRNLVQHTCPLTLAGLRGRWVLLDFWTSCCGNCLHIIDELRPFEAKYHDVLTVIGVHSPKFSHEKADETVEAAVERNEIAHPVLNDPDIGCGASTQSRHGRLSC